MKLSEIQQIHPGVYIYTTSELVDLIYNRYPGLGTEIYDAGIFDMTGDQDRVIYNIEQAMEDFAGELPEFSITDIIESPAGRKWHVIYPPDELPDVQSPTLH